MKHVILVIAVALGLFGMADRASAAAAAPTAFGLWLNEVQGWIVEAKACDTGLCAYLVSFRKTKTDDYVAKDSQNPDPNKRDTPLCGLMLIGGFTPSKDDGDKWENGWVYDPDTGSTYSGEAELVNADKVELRGYVMVPLFGKTLTLVRQPDDIARCSVPSKTSKN